MSGAPQLDWKKTPLIPAVAQDCNSSEVLMLAYMNKEALDLTLSSGFAHYYSRSKQRIWKKGETSGHLQKIEQILLDCDGDTILLRVEQQGVACHTGRKSCFFVDIKSGSSVAQPLLDSAALYGAVDTLYHDILNKKNGDATSSYTASLFAKGVNTIGKKVIEEAGELALSIKDTDQRAVVYEAADLVYHALVALAYSNASPDLVRQELVRRMGTSGLEEKRNRK